MKISARGLLIKAFMCSNKMRICAIIGEHQSNKLGPSGAVTPWGMAGQGVLPDVLYSTTGTSCPQTRKGSAFLMPAKLTREKFIERCRAIHGGKYDYSRLVYTGTRDKVVIGCPRHGWFEQVADTHLYNKSGCPVCSDGGTLEERFWAFVDKNGPVVPHMDDECWVWLGSIHHKGYGEFRAGKMVKAHVFSYELNSGPIPPDDNAFGRLFVLHHCDNPACVRPSHLFLGTPQDNMVDMVQKGRNPDFRGEKAGNSKLTWKDVREIRDLYAGGKWMQRELGEKFGVTQTCIGSIIRGETWKE